MKWSGALLLSVTFAECFGKERPSRARIILRGRRGHGFHSGTTFRGAFSGRLIGASSTALLIAFGLFELARAQPDQRIVLVSVSSVAGPTWPNACHVCEVEIDPDTGHVDVVAYSSVNDVGRVVNPMIVIGQLDGGAMQGIGQALTEHFVFDRESGQALSASLLDYAMPLASHAPPFRTTMDESTLCRNNALGMKGVGELGTIGATPAVANAVVDAFVRAGAGARAETLQMPFTPSRVWDALQDMAQ